MVRWLLVLLTLATPAQANVGKWWSEGARTTEPGGLREVVIAHETLRFDLRTVGRARVSATYALDNRGLAPVSAPLVFVAGTAMRDVDIAFDRARLYGRTLASDVELPAAWRAPVATPSIDGEESIGYEADQADAVAFDLVIPPGKHELVVEYSAAVASRKRRESPTIVYQLGYVLAPARDWGGFGTLDVTVEVPAGWRVATSPRLARDGDTLRGRFPLLPGDTIGISLRAAAGTLHAVLQYLLPLLVLFVVVGGVFALRAIGRARGRAEDLRKVWPVSLPAALLWAFAIAVTGSFTAMRGGLALPDGQSGAHGYGGALGMLFAIFMALVAIPFGMWIASLASRSANRTQPLGDE